MIKMIDCVLLVDDNRSDNFIHRKIIENSGLVRDIVIKSDGEEALNFLRSTHGSHHYPSLIFLDINMPRMNGWEFLEAFKELPEQDKSVYVVTLLTTSLSEDDEERAGTYNKVIDFISKPLTPEVFERLVRQYFPTLLD